MTPVEAGRCLAHLMAAFPHPQWTAERTALFAGELGRWPALSGEKTVVELIRSNDRCPSVAQLVEGCRLHTTPGNALPRGRCALCEDGWVTVSTEGRSTVAVCPNGCPPNGGATPTIRRSEPLHPADLERNRERLAGLLAALKGATRMPAAKGRPRKSQGRYRVDTATGNAEPIPRADLR